MRLLLLMSVLFLTGCSWSVKPALPPVSPPPNVPEGVLLMTVPPGLLEDHHSAPTRKQLLHELAEFEASEPELAAQVLRHEVRSGMTTRHVVFSFVSHPTRVVDQGPPGGHTLLWGTGSPFTEGRYWVRFDEYGHATAAGRY